MAVTQERYEMQVAMRLKQDGWIPHIFENKRISEVKAMADWCIGSFGPMYNDMTWAGKWYGAQLPFRLGGVDVNWQVVFMFRDDKLYTMFKMMWPE